MQEGRDEARRSVEETREGKIKQERTRSEVEG